MGVFAGWFTFRARRRVARLRCGQASGQVSSMYPGRIPPTKRDKLGTPIGPADSSVWALPTASVTSHCGDVLPSDPPIIDILKGLPTVKIPKLPPSWAPLGQAGLMVPGPSNGPP